MYTLDLFKIDYVCYYPTLVSLLVFTTELLAREKPGSNAVMRT